MNTDQQNRLEIMKALEKDFPDRTLEDLIEVARYVEGNGTPTITLQTPEVGIWHIEDSDAKFLEEAAYISEPRTWKHLDHIPDDVRAVTDPDGDVIRRVALGDALVWQFEAERYQNTLVIDGFAPFTEVLS